MQRKAELSELAKVGDYVHVKLDIYRDYFVRVVEVDQRGYIRADDGKVYALNYYTDRLGRVFYV